MNLDVTQRSVLDRYQPVTLGAVHRLHAATETGGFTLKTEFGVSGFRLSIKDIRSLHGDLGFFLEAHDLLVQAAKDGDGSGSPISSASSTALSTASEA